MSQRSRATYVDVSKVLERGIAALQLGELVSKPGFAMEQAMTAIEIGDPRMDMPLDTDYHLPTVLERPIERDLSYAQLANLLDAVTSKVVQWWCGHGLLQTVYTSVHVVARDKLQDDTQLAALTSVVSGIVSVSRAIITGGPTVVMEEDCSIYSHLADEPATTPSLIAKVNDKLSKAMGACEKAAYAGDVAALAALCRLALLKRLFMVLIHMGNPAAKPALEKAQTALQLLLSALDDVESSQDAVADGPAPGIILELHKSAFPMPPPTITPMSNEEARTKLRAAAEHLQRSCGVLSITTLPDLLALVDYQSRTSEVSICRGVLQLLLAPPWANDDEELPPWAPSPSQYLQELHLPRSLPEQASELQMFLSQAQIAVCNLVLAKCLNRARVRRRLRKGMEDLSRLHQHALNADESPELQSLFASKRSGWDIDPSQPYPVGPCSMWVEMLMNTCLLDFFFMGFELGLMCNAEYAFAFWFCEYLCATQWHVFQKFRSARPKDYLPTKKKKDKPAALSYTPEEHHRLNLDQVKMMRLECLRHICAACWHLASALERLGIIAVMDPVFGTPEDRFAQRFEVATVVPALRQVTYHDVHRYTHPEGITPDKLLQTAGHFFQAAADELARLAIQLSQVLKAPGWEIEELAAMQTVARRNMTASKLLFSSYASGNAGTFVGSWEFTVHRHFPTIVLKRRVEK